MDLKRKMKTTLLYIAGKLSEDTDTGAIYYIGGTDILPAPLDMETENQILITLSKEENQNAKNALIEHNLRLVVYIAKKFDNTGVGVEDLISIGTIGLIKAVNTYKLDKNIKLATYASRCIENEILMHLRKISRNKGEVSIDEPLNTDFDGNELLLSDILGTEEDETSKGMEVQAEKMILFHSLEKLSKREKKIICLRFGLHNIRVNQNDKVIIEEREEMTQKEVAELLGISQSYISRLEKKIMKQLKKDILKES